MMRIKVALLALCLASPLASCASTPRSEPDLPQSWVAAPASDGCEALSGTYRVMGLSSPGNERPRATDSWPSRPSTRGSLLTLIAPRVDVGAADDVWAIRIKSGAADGTAGNVAFRVLSSRGDSELPSSRSWTCSGGSLSGRATLPAADPARSATTRYESSVRLWKSADGALLSEETIESVARHVRRSSLVHRKLATLYVRFDAASQEVSGEPATHRLSE